MAIPGRKPVPWHPPGGNVELVIPGVGMAHLADAYRIIWTTGIGLADILLRQHQLPLYEADKGARSHSITVQVCSRRYGKTFEKLTLAVEAAIQNRDSVIRFAFPAQKQAESIIEPNIRRILSTCPPDLAPNVKLTSGGFIEFANKSRIYLAGTDDKDQRERLRGMEALLIIVDEAGSHKELEYVVDDILGPQIDTGGGKLILVSTPPKSMDHAFVDYWSTARRDGTLVVKTIKQNTYYSRATLLRICRKANKQAASDAEVEMILDGKVEGSPTWEREYMCRMVTDKRLRVCPDFIAPNEEQATTPHVGIFDKPKHVTRYVFIDQGHATDYFSAVFASHLFGPGGGQLFVEDVWQDRRKPTDYIVGELKRVERSLGWNGPVRRYANDPRGDQQRMDMRTRGYQVTRAAKSEGAEAEADRLNLSIRAGRILIHARCTPLIEQLRDGIWRETDNGKADFQRSEMLGHLDALSALAMGVRCVDWRLNALPPETFDMDNWIVPKGLHRPELPSASAVRSAFSGIFKH